MLTPRVLQWTPPEISQWIMILALIYSILIYSSMVAGGITLVVLIVKKKWHILSITMTTLGSAVTFIGLFMMSTDRSSSFYINPDIKSTTIIFGLLLLSIGIIILSLRYLKNTKTEERKIGRADELGKYKELLDKGAITQEEYDVKKEKTLNE
jgi:hypothetical protein